MIVVGLVPFHVERTALSVPDWALFTASWQLRSGTAFTPVVAGDINGDGIVNDGAFVFNPSQTTDTSVTQLLFDCGYHEPMRNHQPLARI